MSRPLIALHGGAGTIARAALDAEKRAAYLAGLRAALEAGAAVLAGGGSALEAATAAVVSLEDCPLFNAGKGAVFNAEGEIEMDACVMDGRTGRAGAIAAVKRVRNPIRGARLVMERSPCVLIAGEAAERFVAAEGGALEDPAYFRTQARWAQLEKARAQGDRMVLDHSGASNRYGTVGAVAVDAAGHLAAATSTGGMTNKRPGRVGDSPVVGAGTYANDATCAVSCTGTGERFIEAVAAYDLSALMAYCDMSLAEAADEVMMKKLTAIGGSGGLVAVDRAGNVAMPYNSEGMYRGWMRPGVELCLAIHDEEERIAL